MAVIFIRTLIIFITLIVVMRILGKRQIGEMQPFEFVITLIIADLACVPMSDVSIPLVYGVVAILGLFLLHQLLFMLESSGKVLKRIISGKPSIVIDKDGVNVKELKRNNLDVFDLIESLRALGYFSLDDIDYAIFESNGKFSALASSKGKDEKTSLPVLLVNDGKVQPDNFATAHLTLKEVKELFGISSVKDVQVLTVDGNGKVYYKYKGQKYRTFFLPNFKEGQW